MKKKMINLKSLQETLNARELKNILGGSGDGKDGKCIACKDPLGTKNCECQTDADKAAEYAGEDNWWCCNCPDASNC